MTSILGREVSRKDFTSCCITLALSRMGSSRDCVSSVTACSFLLSLKHHHAHDEENEHLQHHSGCGYGDKKCQIVRHISFSGQRISCATGAHLRNVRRCTFDTFAGGFAISLAPRLVGRADLVFLLVQVVASLIGPASCLFTSLAGALFNRITAIFRDLANTLARFFARLRGIKNSYRRADTQAGQEPQETTSVASDMIVSLKNLHESGW